MRRTGIRWRVGLALLAAGCASRPASVVRPVIPPADQVAGAASPESVAEILRLAPRPLTAELMLFAWNPDGSLRPFFRGEPVIGTDTSISPAEAVREAVLLVRAPGHFPQAYQFVFSEIADFFPTLRPLPANGPATPRGEAEELGEVIRRLVEAGRVVDP